MRRRPPTSFVSRYSAGLPEAAIDAFADNPILNSKAPIKQHYEDLIKISIPIPAAGATLDWENASYTIINDPTNPLVYSFGKIYDTKSAYDKDTFTTPGLQYICLTPDSENPLLSAIIPLMDLYSYYSISSDITLEVKYTSSTDAPVISYAATARGWSKSFPAMPSIIGNSGIQGTLSYSNPRTVINFGKHAGSDVFCNLSNISNVQATDKDDNVQKNLTWDFKSDGPMFVFMPQYNGSNSTSTGLVAEVLLTFRLSLDEQQLNSAFIANYSKWKSNNYSTSDIDPPTGTTQISQIQGGNVSNGTVPTDSIKIGIGSKRYKKGYITTKSGSFEMSVPKSAAYTSPKIYYASILREINRLGVNSDMMKSIRNVATLYNVFGVPADDELYGMKSTTFVNHLNRQYGVGSSSGGAEIVDGTDIYAYAHDGTIPFNEEKSYGCGGVPECSSLLTTVTMKDGGGVPGQLYTIQGYESTFKPSNNISITYNDTEVCPEDMVAVQYHPFFPTDNSFSSESTTGAIKWYYEHIISIPDKAVDPSDKNYTLMAGADHGAGIAGEPIYGDVGEIEGGNLAVRLSTPVKLPEDLLRSNDLKFKQQYTDLIRKELHPSNSLIKTIVGGVGAVANALSGLLPGDPRNPIGQLAGFSGSGGKYVSGKNAVGSAAAFQAQHKLNKHNSLLSTAFNDENEKFLGGYVTIQDSSNLTHVEKKTPLQLIDMFKVFPMANKFTINPPSNSSAQMIKVDLSMEYCCEGTVLMSMPVGIATLQNSNEGHLCFADNLKDLTQFKAGMPKVVVNCYPVVSASLVPPENTDFFKQAIILNDPTSSFTQTSANTNPDKDIIFTKMRIKSNDSGSTYCDIPAFSVPIQYSNTIGLHDTIYIPDALPNENGELVKLNTGDKVYLNSFILLQIVCESSYAFMSTFNDMNSATKNYNWYMWDNSKGTITNINQQILSTDDAKFHGGFLLGFAAGNTHIIDNKGTITPSLNDHCMDCLNINYSYMSNTPVSDYVEDTE